MNNTWESEFERLLTAVLDGSAESDDLRRLDGLLAENPAAMNAYIALMQVDAMLRWRSGLGASGDGRRRAVDSVVCEDEAHGDNLNRASQSVVDDELESPSRVAYPSNGFGAADRLDSPPFSSSFYSFGGILFSYTTLALILGLALLAGWTWRISLERQVVQDAPRRVRASATAETHFVGRITGTADCHWADPKTEAFDRDGVLLGRMYALTSGFLEITYDTGARSSFKAPSPMKSSRPAADTFRWAS